MSTLVGMLVLYACGAVLWAPLCALGFALSVSWEERRAFARGLLLTPVWLIVAVFGALVGLRGAWRAAEFGELFERGRR